MTPDMTLVDELTTRLATDPNVVGIALGGSHAGAVADERSDLDLYVFGDHPPSLALRRRMAFRWTSSPSR